MSNTHRRRRRDPTIELSRVGGVYWADIVRRTVYSDRLSSGAGAVAKPHLRRSSPGEPGAVRVRTATLRQRLASQTDSHVKPRYDCTTLNLKQVLQDLHNCCSPH